MFQVYRNLAHLHLHNCPRLRRLPELPERLVSIAVDIDLAHNFIVTNITKH